jgi:hypothetical protein
MDKEAIKNFLNIKNLIYGIITSVIGSWIYSLLNGYGWSINVLQFLRYKVIELEIWHILVFVLILGLLIWLLGCKRINKLKKELSDKDFQLFFSAIQKNKSTLSYIKIEILKSPTDYEFDSFINILFSNVPIYGILHRGNILKLFLKEDIKRKDIKNNLLKIKEEAKHIAFYMLFIEFNSQSIFVDTGKHSSGSSIESIKKQHKTKEDFFNEFKNSHKSFIKDKLISEEEFYWIYGLVWAKAHETDEYYK